MEEHNWILTAALVALKLSPGASIMDIIDSTRALRKSWPNLDPVVAAQCYFAPLPNLDDACLFGLDVSCNEA